MVAEYVRNVGLVIFPKLGLILFLTVYVAAIWLVFSPERKKLYETLSTEPLDLEPSEGEKTS